MEECAIEGGIIVSPEWMSPRPLPLSVPRGSSSTLVRAGLSMASAWKLPLARRWAWRAPMVRARPRSSSAPLTCARPTPAASKYSAWTAGRPQRARLAYVPERFVPPYYLLGREFLAMTLELGGARFVHASAVALAAELELDPQPLERPVR